MGMGRKSTSPEGRRKAVILWTAWSCLGILVGTVLLLTVGSILTSGETHVGTTSADTEVRADAVTVSPGTLTGEPGKAPAVSLAGTPGESPAALQAGIPGEDQGASQLETPGEDQSVSQLETPGEDQAAPQLEHLGESQTASQTENSGEVSAAGDPSTAPGPAKKPGEILVVLDPGHGGIDEGCMGGEIQEKDINLAIALLVKQKLLDLGYSVVMTREEDCRVSLEERVELANESRGDILVSIHQNSYEGEKVSGIETWYVPGAEGEGASPIEAEEAVPAGAEKIFPIEAGESGWPWPETVKAESSGDPAYDLGEALEADRAAASRRLARLVQMETVSASRAEDRQAQEKAYYVLANTAMPSCLIETGFLTNEEECAALADEAYQEKIASGIAEGIELYFHPKTMYLTFDDGPKPGNTEAVLDLLKEQGIHATFFLVGKSVEKYPELAKRIADEGHTIGIHSYSHDYQKIYADADSFLEDFQKAYDIIREATGTEPWLFRFPGGSVNSYNKEVYQDIMDEMEERGFVYFDWNASLQDAVKNPVKEELLESARSSAHNRKKVVMLAHDVKDATVECLPQLLDLFPEYRMEPLTPQVTPVQFKKE